MPHTFNGSIEILPNDVILLIAEYLDKADLKQCTCVSFAWNNLFRSVFYRTVKITEYSNFCSFYRTLEESSSTADLGHSVRTLHLQDGLLTIAHMQKLAVLCPKVTSIYYEWNDYGYKVIPTPSTRVFGSPLPLFEHFHPSSLRSLNLQSSNTLKYRHIFTPKVLYSILRYMPQLESLTLGDRMRFVTIAFMEQLHATCVKLKELIIPGENIRSVDDKTVPMKAIKNVDPAKAMESLSIDSFCPTMQGTSVWADEDVLTGPWFTYIVHKYPALKRLSMLSNRLYTKASYRSGNRATQTFPKVALREFFPQLDELELSVFANKTCTRSPHLVKGIRKIRLCDDIEPYFSEWISNEATSNLGYLSLSSFPNNLNDLRHCPQLKELELACSKSKTTTTMVLIQEYVVDIDLLLSCCPILKKLTVCNGNICYGGDSRTEASLKTLIFRNVMITSNALFDHIGRRCPSLIHLELSECMWTISRNAPVILINLPQHRLSYFRISNPHIYNVISGSHQNHGRSIIWNKYFMLKTQDSSNRSSHLFIDDIDRANESTYFTRQVNNPGIIRTLNAIIGDESNGHSETCHEAVNATLPFARTISSDNEVVSDVPVQDSRRYGSSATVLRCHSIDRLHYGSHRLNLDSNTLFYRYT